MQDTERLFLVLEYAPAGDLFREVRKKKKPLPEHVAVTGVLLPVMDALSYLHSKSVMHRDLKPENLLVAGNLREGEGMVKLCDFGLSLNFSAERPVTRLGTLVGISTRNACPPSTHSHCTLPFRTIWPPR